MLLALLALEAKLAQTRFREHRRKRLQRIGEHTGRFRCAAVGSRMFSIDIKAALIQKIRGAEAERLSQSIHFFDEKSAILLACLRAGSKDLSYSTRNSRSTVVG